jgi:hypothetical protein
MYTVYPEKRNFSLHSNIYIYIYIYINILPFEMENKQFSLIRLLFAHHANVSLSFVHLLTKKQTEVNHLQTE